MLKHLPLLFALLGALGLQGCFAETPECKRLEQELNQIYDDLQLNGVTDAIRYYIDGEWKQDPVLKQRATSLRQEIMDNQCIDFVATGVRG